MKHLLFALALACGFASNTTAAPLEWFTDVQAAQAKAAREHKAVLLDFTGSDWCGWCMKLKAEVFDQREFADFVRDKLVLVEVDFPHNKPQTPNEVKVNQQLAQALHVEGFPTVYLLDSTGHVLDKTGYLPGGPKPFIAELQRILQLKPASDNSIPDPAPVKPYVYVPVPPAAPVHYNDLALKGISGSKSSRMALINNQTFMAGETAQVKVQDRRVEIHCLEIREDSVSVTVDGQPMQLKLGAH